MIAFSVENRAKADVFSHLQLGLRARSDCACFTMSPDESIGFVLAHWCFMWLQSTSTMPNCEKNSGSSGPDVLHGITMVLRCMSYVWFHRGSIGRLSCPFGAHVHHFAGAGTDGGGQGAGEGFGQASGVRQVTWYCIGESSVTCSTRLQHFKVFLVSS